MKTNEICQTCRNDFVTCGALPEQLTLDEITGAVIDCDIYEKAEVFHIKVTYECGDKIAIVEKDVRELPNLKWKSKTAAGYGEFKNVKLTDQEIEKLQRDYPHEYADAIEALSNYLATKGKRYKSHYAVIRTWIRREQKERAEREEISRRRSQERNNKNKLQSAPSYDINEIRQRAMQNTDI